MGNIQVLNNMQRIDTKAFKWLRICTFFLDHNLFLRARTASSNFVLSSPSCLRALRLSAQKYLSLSKF